MEQLCVNIWWYAGSELQREVFALFFLTLTNNIGIHCRSKMQILGIKVPRKYHCVSLCSHSHLYSPAVHSCEHSNKMDKLFDPV